MIGRRSFLRAVGATLISTPSLSFFRHFLDTHGNPYLETVARSQPLGPAPTAIYLKDYLGDGEFRLLLDTPNEEPNEIYTMTNAQFADEFMGGWEDMCQWLNADCVDDDGNPDPSDPLWQHAHDTVNSDFAFEYWVPRYSPDALAFDYLESLDLGLFDTSRDTDSGWIEFTNGVCPGNDSRFVDVDALGASLLQRRLIERNYDVQLILATG